MRYACPADHEKRLVVAMIETLEAIDNIDQLLAVDGIDVFFVGPGDLSQNMGYPPAPPFGQPRPQAVSDKVGFAVEKIRDAGKIAGTLVTSDELPFWLDRGVQLLLRPFRSLPSRRAEPHQEGARTMSLAPERGRPLTDR